MKTSNKQDKKTFKCCGKNINTSLWAYAQCAYCMNGKHISSGLWLVNVLLNQIKFKQLFSTLPNRWGFRLENNSEKLYSFEIVVYKFYEQIAFITISCSFMWLQTMRQHVCPVFWTSQLDATVKTYPKFKKKNNYINCLV